MQEDRTWTSRFLHGAPLQSCSVQPSTKPIWSTLNRHTRQSRSQETTYTRDYPRNDTELNDDRPEMTLQAFAGTTFGPFLDLHRNDALPSEPPTPKPTPPCQNFIVRNTPAILAGHPLRDPVQNSKSNVAKGGSLNRRRSRPGQPKPDLFACTLECHFCQVESRYHASGAAMGNWKHNQVQLRGMIQAFPLPFVTVREP